jgi:N-acyl homoserine lactone hydrolase
MLQERDIITLPLATVTYPDSHPLAGQTGVVNAFLLRHPDGPILVDTGVGEGSAEIDRWYQPTRRPLAEALGAHGLAVGEIAALINTHLHFDHCGGNRLFADVPIYVQAAEYEAARRPNFTIVEWVEFPGAAYRTLAGEAQIAPGVRVLPTPGHTPGHQAVLVETDAGLAVIAGQAVQSLGDYRVLHETGELPPESDAPDVPAYRRSARAIRALGPSRVYFSHDEHTWQDRG